MPISEQQLAEGLEHIYDHYSNRIDIDPAETRKQIAKEQAKLFFQAMIGRRTIVTARTITGESVTGTGTIQV